MSKFVKVQTQLRDLNLIKRALDDLKLEYAEDQRFTHLWSGFSGNLPVVVRTQGATFGLRLSEEGHYEAVGDDMQMAAIRRTLGRVQRGMPITRSSPPQPRPASIWWKKTSGAIT